MSEETQTEKKSNELNQPKENQLEDLVTEVVKGIAQSKELSEWAKVSAPTLIKKAKELWQKDPENYEKELEELKKQLPTTSKNVSPEEIQKLEDFIVKLLEAQEKLLSIAEDAHKIGQFIALIQQKRNIIELLKNSPNKLKTIRDLFKDSSLSKIPIVGILDNINLTFKFIKEMDDPEVLDYLDKQIKAGKETAISWYPRAVIKKHEEQLKADPTNIFNIISAFETFVIYYPFLMLVSPLDAIVPKLSNAYEKYIAPVFKDSKVGLYSHLLLVYFAELHVALAKVLPKNIKAKLNETGRFEEKLAELEVEVKKEKINTLLALRGQRNMER